MIKTILLVLSISLSAFAGNTNSSPYIDDVIDSISADLDKDGIKDLVYLSKPEKQAQEDYDLWFKISSEGEFYKVEGAVAVYNDGIEYSLQVNEAGSVQMITNSNSPWSRGSWIETQTYAYRKGTLVLAGYTYQEMDDFQEYYSTCDINLLSRKGTYVGNDLVNGGTFEVRKEDVLSVDEVSFYSLQETYIWGEYCSNSHEGNEEE